MNKRRDFLKKAGLLGAFTASGLPAWAQHRPRQKRAEPYVNFTRDGLDFAPGEYARLLTEIDKATPIAPDSYGNGGIVAQLEEKIAAKLGKEAAVYMPTGTLANLIAVRQHSRPQRRRVLVQAASHLYNDTGDGAQLLAGLNLVPLRSGERQFALADVEAEYQRATRGRVRSEIGVIAIESPVRRVHNRVFDYDEMQKIAAWAHQHEVKMHLDGARLFNMPAHTGISVREYAALFDTVYVSLYKDFNAASGAVLVGSAAFCEGLYHTRRMFGGSMPQAWPFAAVALQYIDSFEQDYRQALQRVKQVFAGLESYRLSALPHGTNVMKLEVHQGDPTAIRDKLLQDNIKLPQPAADFHGFYIKVNPSILRTPADALRQALAAAAG